MKRIYLNSGFTQIPINDTNPLHYQSIKVTHILLKYTEDNNWN